ncbi:hypothetical protein M409DRAFT_17383 [Zasmidium cellare ATCC 36951]|uniref:Uncharacterized protein n=1 Tax=Zasmidium cellare ATCC 36951 TaxID=1080233 RepID=A0A6A6CZH1_ZASCE|nr:uncharacterized protein M409DRAFT_17383 [Zasmidium cellare ATCC 36951]KAF2172143.1 hypothetical protein M409DRAFT_17383 [Zasmidium cellare ATCC 36951]
MAFCPDKITANPTTAEANINSTAMAEPPAQTFDDLYFDATSTDKCEHRLILQLRDTVARLDDSNYEEISTLVRVLLDWIPCKGKPRSLDELMFGLAKINSNRSVKAEAGVCNHVPPSAFIPTAGNPFYDPRLELSGAAQQIVDIIIAAKDAVRGWRLELTDHGSNFFGYLQTMDISPDHAVNQVIKDLHYTLEFLRNGRGGWDLVDWPHKFYEDVLLIATEFLKHAQDVSSRKGCEALRVLPSLVDQIIKRLNEIQKMRWEAEEECSQQHEEQIRKEEEAEENRRLLARLSWYVKPTPWTDDGLPIEEAPDYFETMLQKKVLMGEPAHVLEIEEADLVLEEEIGRLDLGPQRVDSRKAV